MDDEAIEDDARAWFQANWDPALSLGTWWQRLADSGWGFPAWPQRWFGRGLSHGQARRVHRARAEVGAFGPPLGIATMMVAPALMDLGTSSQQQRYLPAIANGTEVWCQLFSEPGAGSDLAAVATRAVRDGDEWVVNGQKVWTSGGHYARWAILVARTNPDVPKHRGLSFFLLDMHQPGVESRPLRQMNGNAEFNEVFLSDARVPHANLVGAEGDGWRVALEVLAHERASLDADAGGGMQPELDLTAPVGSYVAADEQADDAMASATGDAARALLADLLRAAGRDGDATARQAVADVTSLVEIARIAGGSLPPSAGKLAATTLMRRMRETALALQGAHATLSGADAPLDGLVQHIALTVPCMSIAGGTDEIQRNILGERVLGLPPEPRVDKDLPFRELRKG
jgi:alkylation response protein AidB-like acyl-CoA dehydrogenase